MARIRSVHPGLTTDEAYMEMSIPAKAAWPVLWTICDDYGAFDWKPKGIKAALFPGDNIDMAAILTEYRELGVVQMVDIDGKPCGIVKNFCRFQTPKFPSYRHQLTPDMLEFVKWKPRKSGKTVAPADDDTEGNEDDDTNPPPAQPQNVEINGTPLPHGEERRGEERNKKEKEGERGALAEAAPASTPRKAASRIPDDWEPSEADAAYASSLGLKVARVSAMFRDHWRAKAGADARKHDWSATWRNWCRREDGALQEPQAAAFAGSVARPIQFPGWETADHMALGQWEAAKASGSWFTQDAKRNLLSPEGRRADLWAFIEAYRPLVASYILDHDRDQGIAA